MKSTLPVTQSIEVYEPENTIWAAPANGGISVGSGSQFDPYRISGPDGFDNLCKLAHHRGRDGILRLAPGVYYTRGTWAFPQQHWCHLPGGWTLIGAGSGETRIELLDPVLETDGNSRPDTNIFWMGRAYNYAYGMHVEGVRFGCEASLAPVVSCGCRFWGVDVVARDVLVEVYGSYEKNIEAFGISCIDVPTTRGSVLFEDCQVHADRPGAYVNAFSVGIRNPGTRAVVRNCEAHLLEDNHAGFTVNHNTTVRDCYVNGARYAVYNDTDSVESVLVDGLRANVSSAALHLVGQKPEDSKRRVRVVNSLFQYDPAADGPTYGMTLWDTTAGKEVHFQDIAIEGSTFLVPGGRPFIASNLVGKRIQHARLSRCTLPGTAVVRHETPGVAADLRENWTSEGKMLPNNGLPKYEVK